MQKKRERNKRKNINRCQIPSIGPSHKKKKQQQQQQKWKIKISQQTKKVAPFSRSHGTRCDIVADVSHINQHTHTHTPTVNLIFFFLVPYSGSIVQQLRLHNGKTSHFHYVYSLNYFLFFPFPLLRVD